MPRFEIGFIGFEARCVPPRLGLDTELHLECPGDRGSYLILNFEYIRQLAVVALRPKLHSVAGINQLRCQAQAAACATDAALENRPDIQRGTDLPDVLLLAPEREGGRACDHLQSRNLRE